MKYTYNGIASFLNLLLLFFLRVSSRIHYLSIVGRNDEGVHINHGIVFWRTAQPDFDPMHPPLVSIFAFPIGLFYDYPFQRSQRMLCRLESLEKGYLLGVGLLL